MKLWRLRWALAEIYDLSNISKHRQALHSPWKYWTALFLKIVPFLWPWPIRLLLKQGGIIAVKEFMTLFIYKEIFIDGCYDLALTTSHEPFIIDVGSNTGLFILRMKQLYPKAHVLGYEPMPSNYLQLKKNIDLSGLENVAIFMEGVGGTSRKEKLYVHPGNIGGHSIYQSQAGDNKYVEIDLIDIHELLRSMNGKTCNLLKLDCEGAEIEIIKSMTKEMAARIEKIVFESTPALYNVNEAIDHLERIGYRVTRYKGLYLAEYQGRNA